MHIWQLKRGADKRFRAGHPWVFNNELAHSPREVAPGDAVELRDAGGGFLARGYGHPHTLIAFRALSRDPALAEPHGAAALLVTLRRAAALRAGLGLGAVSHRLVHGEADDLPGLIVDRYRLVSGDAPGDAAGAAQAYVVQQHTAGAERLHEPLLAALEALTAEAHAAHPTAPDWARTGVVLRNDVGMRRLEGLPDDGARVLRAPPGVVLEHTAIRVADPLAATGPGEAPPFRVNLVGGQKTGFFLDQAANVRLAAQLLGSNVLGARLRAAPPTGQGGPVRILDLFAYVGQWGAHLARTALAAQRATGSVLATAGGGSPPGSGVEVTVLDASAPALELAAANVQAVGAACIPLRADALETLGDLLPRAFDAVVVDPPAFIKGRKAYHTGRAAYVKLNTNALRLVRPGGLVVTCSCSQALDAEDFLAVLHKAAGRAERTVRWVAHGGQGPDHPVLAAFPEGDYLKCRIGIVD